MRICRTVSLLVASAVSLGQVQPAQAGTARISILLTGDGCAAQRQALADHLREVPGIVFVDGRSVPDHLLIDVEDGTPTVEQLVRRLNDALTSTPCKAEEMKSCISADLMSHQTALR
jgi:hypothetical protein